MLVIEMVIAFDEFNVEYIFLLVCLESGTPFISMVLPIKNVNWNKRGEFHKWKKKNKRAIVLYLCHWMICVKCNMVIVKRFHFCCMRNAQTRIFHEFLISVIFGIYLLLTSCLLLWCTMWIFTWFNVRSAHTAIHPFNVTLGSIKHYPVSNTHETCTIHSQQSFVIALCAQRYRCTWARFRIRQFTLWIS